MESLSLRSHLNAAASPIALGIREARIDANSAYLALSAQKEGTELQQKVVRGVGDRGGRRRTAREPQSAIENPGARDHGEFSPPSARLHQV